VSRQTATLKQLGPGLFAFEFPRELQGGLALQVQTKTDLTVKVRFGEELLQLADPGNSESPIDNNNDRYHDHDLYSAHDLGDESNINTVDNSPFSGTGNVAKPKPTPKPKKQPVPPNCTTTVPSEVGRVCYMMRTGSKYEDVWTLPAGPAYAENHEYITGRYGELVFNDSSVTASDVVIGAWVVNSRYDSEAAATMNSSDINLNAVWEMTKCV
jgi:hypothetical protein